MKKLSRSKGFKITPNGQWEFPGENTLIPSNQITMKGVPYPVFGMDDTGYSQMMYPGMEYTYPGSMVYEIPMAQDGKQKGVPDFNKLYDEYKTIQSQINQYIGNNEGGKKEQEYRLKLNDLANKLVEEGVSIENTDYVPQHIKQDSNSHYCIGSSCYILNQAGENFKYFSNSNFQDDVIAGKVPGRTFDYSAKGVVPGDIIQFKRSQKGSPYHAYLIQDISAPDKDGNRKVIAVGSAGSGPMQNKEYTLTKDNKITSEYDGVYDVQTIRRERFDKNIAPNDLLKKRDALKADLEKYYPNYKKQNNLEKFTEVNDDPNVIYNYTPGTAFEWNKKNRITRGNPYSPTGRTINLEDSKISEILNVFSNPDYKQQFMAAQNVSPEEYDAIVKNVIGIYGQETKFGTREEALGLSKFLPGLYKSVGPFQINPDNLKTKRFSRDDLFDPIKGAEAAATFLAENIQMLRNRANAKPEDDIYSKNLRKDNYLEYLSLLMNDRDALAGDKKRIELGLPILEGKSSYKRNVDQYIQDLGVEAIPISRSAPEYKSGGTFNPDTDEFIGFVDELPQAQTGKQVMRPDATVTKSNLFQIDPSTKFSLPTAKFNDPYSELESLHNQSSKNYYDAFNSVNQWPELSGKTIKLTTNRYRGANVPVEYIDMLKESAKRFNIDPYVLYAIAGRESTFGQGSEENRERSRSPVDLVSGWNITEQYQPYGYDRFLADNKTPNIKEYKDKVGYSYSVDYDSIDNINNYIIKNNLVNRYKNKLEDTRNINYKNPFDFLSEFIVNKGIEKYNPGDPDYRNKINNEIRLLKMDPEFSRYANQKFGGLVKAQNGKQFYLSPEQLGSREIMQPSSTATNVPNIARVKRDPIERPDVYVEQAKRHQAELEAEKQRQLAIINRPGMISTGVQPTNQEAYAKEMAERKVAQDNQPLDEKATNYAIETAFGIIPEMIPFLNAARGVKNIKNSSIPNSMSLGKNKGLLSNKPINNFGEELPNMDLEELRRIYHNSERFLQPEESRFLNQNGLGLRENYLTRTPNTSSNQLAPPPSEIHFMPDGTTRTIYNQQPITDYVTIERDFIDLRRNIARTSRNNLTGTPNYDLNLLQADYDRMFDGLTPIHYPNLTTRQANEAQQIIIRNNPDLIRTKKVVAPTIRNKSGLTKEEALAKAPAKDKDIVSKMSETEFENTVLKPNGEVVPYYQGSLEPHFTGSQNVVPLNLKEYTDAFNARLDLLNDIIAQNNKSGIEYRVKSLDENGLLTFYTPEQSIPVKLTDKQKANVEWFTRDPKDWLINKAGLKQKGDKWKMSNEAGGQEFNTIDEAIEYTRNEMKQLTEPNKISGESTFTVRINPGQWKGDVQDIASKEYFRGIPGLEMSSTTSGVFSDRIPRRGTGTYESLNEYLKKLDLGRIKPGFNSQTSFSRGAWENFIKSGRGVGYYDDPNTVYGIMKKQGGSKYKHGGMYNSDTDEFLGFID